MAIRVLQIIILTFILATPAASATHWTLYSAGFDDAGATTSEDDGREINAPGNVLHGRINKVVAPGRQIGDGGLFLDARVANGPGLAIYAGSLLGEGSDRLLPGTHELAAWYGHWTDLDSDGVIGDVHDAECGIQVCITDEFVWRGIGSGATDVTAASYEFPGASGTSIGGSRILEPGNELAGYGAPGHYRTGALQDRTSRVNAEQAWIGRTQVGLDHGLLATVQMIVIAGAQRAVGGQLAYDFDDPNALYDVDVYEAISGDAEALYASARALHYTATDPIVEVNAMVGDLIDELAPNLTQTVINTAITTFVEIRDIATGTALGLASDPAGPTRGLDPTTFARSQYMSPDAREPNTALDDYDGRAAYGGVGDIAGSYNTYPGYIDGYHLYFDNVARFGICGGAYARVPATTLESSGPSLCQHGMKGDPTFLPNSDPLGAQFAKQRTAPVSLMFHGYLFLWQDLNGDAHAGDVCDPADAEEFDAERNACKNPPYPWPHQYFGEHLNICSDIRAKGTTFTITPLSGDWEGVIIARNVQETTRLAFEPESWEFATGTDPITLRWADTCQSAFGYPSGVRARDELIFTSGGNKMPLHVRAEVSLSGYKDVDKGIDVGYEYVIDHDILPAAL